MSNVPYKDPRDPHALAMWLRENFREFLVSICVASIVALAMSMGFNYAQSREILRVKLDCEKKVSDLAKSFDEKLERTVNGKPTLLKTVPPGSYLNRIPCASPERGTTVLVDVSLPPNDPKAETLVMLDPKLLTKEQLTIIERPADAEK